MSDQTVESFYASTTAQDAAPRPAQPGHPSTTDPAPGSPVADGVVRLGGGAAAPVETEPLFHLDGVTYSIPKRVGANVALRVMARFEQAGEVSAQVYMLRSVLGPDAFEALMGCDDLTPEQFSAISDKVQDLVLSSAQSAAGK